MVDIISKGLLLATLTLATCSVARTGWGQGWADPDMGIQAGAIPGDGYEVRLTEGGTEFFPWTAVELGDTTIDLSALLDSGRTICAEARAYVEGREGEGRVYNAEPNAVLCRTFLAPVTAPSAPVLLE